MMNQTALWHSSSENNSTEIIYNKTLFDALLWLLVTITKIHIYVTLVTTKNEIFFESFFFLSLSSLFGK